MQLQVGRARIRRWLTLYTLKTLVTDNIKYHLILNTFLYKKLHYWALWFSPVIPALKKLRQKN
jgi:hypothetical protein